MHGRNEKSVENSGRKFSSEEGYFHSISSRTKLEMAYHRFDVDTLGPTIHSSVNNGGYFQGTRMDEV
jgi:hypothetical protein